jgi:hypothetical protein
VVFLSIPPPWPRNFLPRPVKVYYLDLVRVITEIRDAREQRRSRTFRFRGHSAHTAAPAQAPGLGAPKGAEGGALATSVGASAGAARPLVGPDGRVTPVPGGRGAGGGGGAAPSTAASTATGAVAALGDFAVGAGAAAGSAASAVVGAVTSLLLAPAAALIQSTATAAIGLVSPTQRPAEVVVASAGSLTAVQQELHSTQTPIPAIAIMVCVVCVVYVGLLTCARASSVPRFPCPRSARSLAPQCRGLRLYEGLQGPATLFFTPLTHGHPSRCPGLS